MSPIAPPAGVLERQGISSVKQRPLLGISAGDPAGIGPEITAKALAIEETCRIARPMVVCDRRIIDDAIRFCRLPLATRAIARPAEGRYTHGVIDVLDVPNVDMKRFAYNTVAAMTGDAAYACVERVIKLALRGEIDATVTGPIHKQALNMAGHRYAGHTEIYAALTGARDCAMMLADGDFRAVHVSLHVSMREACDRVKRARVLRVIELADDACRRLGIAAPRIAVGALNPHCGEGGLFGREEIEEIAPAVEDARKRGFNAEGPIPSDTVFSKMRGGQYDVVVAMYHDQGHIPIKLAGLRYDHTTDAWTSVSGVNVTLGLPIIRTSVDHGVAFDKAGQGRANPESMIQAIQLAARLARHSRPRSA
ncbi:MAG: 4-hydroxythreonine-4-phosphate dehydrogenase PdxA [Lentisphaerae bacterium]|nr:4-hydroxythreonine-4-phosphate dehydrogenase PdxA [Lentisphaerota bacterium]